MNQPVTPNDDPMHRDRERFRSANRTAQRARIAKLAAEKAKTDQLIDDYRASQEAKLRRGELFDGLILALIVILLFVVLAVSWPVDQ